jgi:hypothetical protein
MSSEVPSKDELAPRSKEQTRSGTHEEIAQDSTAYNSDTNPQSQKQSVGQEVCSNFNFSVFPSDSSSSSYCNVYAGMAAVAAVAAEQLPGGGAEVDVQTGLLCGFWL